MTINRVTRFQKALFWVLTDEKSFRQQTNFICWNSGNRNPHLLHKIMSSFRLIEILSYSCLFEKGRSRETHCFGRRPHAYFHGAPARLSRSNWTFMPGEGETKRIYIIFLYLWFTCFSLRMVKYLPKDNWQKFTIKNNNDNDIFIF